MTVEYSTAAEVQEIADQLIARNHPHLQDVDVRYIFRSEAAVSGTKIVLGKARKVGGLNAFLAGSDEPFFCMEIAGDEWKRLSASQRKALVDHELEHFNLDNEKEPPALILVDHDVAEFEVIINRHGLWKPDLERFGKAVQQRLDLKGVGAS